MESQWHFNKRPLPASFIPEQFYSFIYLITHIPSNKLYLGKKCLWHKVWVKRGVYKLVETDWKGYWGSSKHLKRHIQEVGHGQFRREILEFFTTAREAHDAEKALLFQIEDWSLYYNSSKCLQHYYPKGKGRSGKRHKGRRKSVKGGV